MTESGAIVVERSGPIAVVTLANEPRRNAVSASMWRALHRHFEEIGGESDIRAVLIRGRGEHFSAGADITAFDTARAGGKGGSSYDDLVEAACRAVEALPQPAIAAIRGICFGAGAALAASCDLRIAGLEAQFAVPAARLGLGYDPRGVMRFLRAFGRTLTAQILFTAGRISAERAYALGALHEIVAADELEARAMALAEAVAGNAPLTLRAAKVALRAAAGADEALLGEAHRLCALADSSADYEEGRRAFAERRPPRFAGV